jgi:hypothetical protein
MISFGRRFAMFVVVLGLTSRVSQAGVVITIQQVGPDVVVTGSGSLNLSALTVLAGGPFGQDPDLRPFDAEAIVGTPPPPTGSVNFFSGSSLMGPTSFGTGVNFDPNSGSGRIFGISGSSGDVVVPDGYTSGTALGTSTDTYSSTTINGPGGLGLIPGTYTWTWGSVANGNADSLTVQIGPAGAVPEPSTAILAVSAVAFVTHGWTRHRRHQRRQASA